MHFDKLIFLCMIIFCSLYKSMIIEFLLRYHNMSLLLKNKEVYRNGGLIMLCYVPHEICWGVFSPASRAGRSLPRESRDQFSSNLVDLALVLDTETKSSPPFLYSSLLKNIKMFLNTLFFSKNNCGQIMLSSIISIYATVLHLWLGISKEISKNTVRSGCLTFRKYLY